MFIKICGITRTEDAKCAIDNGANALGFIAYPKSPRYIAPQAVKPIIDTVPCDIRKVAVFVNASIEEIKAYIDAGIDILQLHGNESAEFANELKATFNLEIWRAIRPKSSDETEISQFKDFPADKFLIDAFCKKEAGGTGKLADWNLAKLAITTLPAPVLLAGGLKKSNINEAINIVKPAGLDLSSGVEISPGIKNHKLIEELFKQLKNDS